MSLPFRFLTLAFLAIFPTFVAGADKVPWYQVEIVVFARPEASVGGEAWPVEAITPLDGRELLPWRGYAGTDTLPFQRLPDTALQMKKEVERLQKNSEVVPLLHTAWLQPGLARDDAVAVSIRSDESDAGWVNGSLRLVLSRFLHLETNLIYHKDGEEEDAVGGPVFQLMESRRMRSREFHYLDHPLFGVLAVVTPYEPAR